MRGTHTFPSSQQKSEFLSVRPDAKALMALLANFPSLEGSAIYL